MRTTTRIRRQPSGPGPLIVLALASISAVGFLVYLGLLHHYSHTTPSVEVAAPIVASAPRIEAQGPLALSLALPAFDTSTDEGREQAYWLRKAQTMVTCPLCISVDQPVIQMTPNQWVTWLALIYTESRYLPWAVSSIGCFGLGQLCFSLDTPDTEASPELNLYASAQEYKRLLNTHDQEVMASLRAYKGTDGPGTPTSVQALSVFDYIRVGGK